jgi:hypothetical protein
LRAMSIDIARPGCLPFPVRFAAGGREARPPNRP